MLTKRLGFSGAQHLCALIGLTLVVNKQPSTDGSCSAGREHCSDDAGVVPVHVEHAMYVQATAMTK